MDTCTKVLAVDLGASSGRVMLASYDGAAIRLEELHRFANKPLAIGEGLHWNAEALLEEIKAGIRKGLDQHPDIASLSVDTWGVDYGVIDKYGLLMYPPHHYRDQRMLDYQAELEDLLPPEEQFRLSGNQPSLINTVYQLFADLRAYPERFEQAERILLMPDLFHYLLSGEAAAERTILSTGGLMDAGTGDLSPAILGRLGIPRRLFAPRVAAGTVLGRLRPELGQALGAAALRVIAGASHDTAAAVAAVPYEDGEPAAFISCGTWSLVGVETPQPVLSDEAYACGFTNEGCCGGGNRLLKNITGLWLLQETQRVWTEAGDALSFAEMTELAGREGPAPLLIDPDDPAFVVPGDMPARIAERYRAAGQRPPERKGAVVRIILDSLADAYRRAVQELEAVTGREIRRIHMVGGGIQNRLLCQLTADATGKTIIAGPVEASALGNALVQLTALGKLSAAGAREIIRASERLEVYRPAGSESSLNKGERNHG
ncbi:rhamnulokinase family protein [Paenibacillus sp. NFR01]|uniref:rhamnulokinase n=1 Tax=Paenibacillus sp. NFR01 TaxID=1566279 RepID=UPI0008C835F2|nr:rhamnulokinase family protein [Paenibacillus sp. NFR01]SET12610.1 rhamnulokinase [Paenibacillus sp. NFR01]